MVAEGAVAEWLPSAAGADALVPVRYRVTAARFETHDCTTFDLAPVGEPITDPEPGQFTMLYVLGHGEVPISVSGCPADDGVLRHTVRAAGPTTRALCRAPVGAMVGVRGPYGRGWDLEQAAGGDVVCVGGGIGLAPVRPVVRRVLAQRDRFERVAVVVGARTPTDLLFPAELDEWVRAGLDVHLTVDAARRGWAHDVGVVTKPLARVAIDPSRSTAVVCGPEPMLRAVARTLSDLGVAPERIQLSLERNMHCGVQRCGHCQLGPLLVCGHGPVVPWSVAEPLLGVRRW